MGPGCAVNSGTRLCGAQLKSIVLYFHMKGMSIFHAFLVDVTLQEPERQKASAVLRVLEIDLVKDDLSIRDRTLTRAIQEFSLEMLHNDLHDELRPLQQLLN